MHGPRGTSASLQSDEMIERHSSDRSPGSHPGSVACFPPCQAATMSPSPTTRAVDRPEDGAPYP
jgi:hypothetical protein